MGNVRPTSEISHRIRYDIRADVESRNRYVHNATVAIIRTNPRCVADAAMRAENALVYNRPRVMQVDSRLCHAWRAMERTQLVKDHRNRRK